MAIVTGEGGHREVWVVWGERFERLLSHPWLPVAINIAALVLLTAALARWTWQVLAPAPVAAPPAPAAQTTPPFNLPALLAANVFGQAPAAAGSASVENIPLSSLNLVLTGVVAAKAGGFALIKVSGEPEAPFGIGQPITAGATLKAVYPDRAIIERAGRAESLMLEGVQAAPVTAGPPVSRAPADIQQRGPNAYVIPREVVQANWGNRKGLLDQGLVVPSRGGGFIVRIVKPGSVYEKAGLRMGDLVRSANGQPLNNIEDLMRIYQQMGSGPVTLEVMRQGKPEQLVYTLQ